MINDLNQVVKGEAPKANEFSPLPEGEYIVKVKEIKPWESQTKNIYVNQKDENGWLIRDANNKIVKKLHKDFTFYNARVTFEVLEGEQKGRKLSENLTTHPNADFITTNFLYAANVGEITVGDIPNKCVDAVMIINVEIQEYIKKTTIKDKETGEETVKEEPRKTNRIVDFIKNDRVEEGIEGL